jgi:hypothetical protein
MQNIHFAIFKTLVETECILSAGITLGTLGIRRGGFLPSPLMPLLCINIIFVESVYHPIHLAFLVNPTAYKQNEIINRKQLPFTGLFSTLLSGSLFVTVLIFERNRYQPGLLS